MSVEIKWIGHASFRIADDKNVMYIDPWKIPDRPHDADVVFVSHEHFDHCSSEDVAKVSKADTVVVAPPDAAGKLAGAKAIAPGQSVTVKGVTIEAVAAYNVDKEFHPKANQWCGAIVAIGGKRIYYAGDTDLIEEMSDLGEIDVALLPVGGTYTLDAAEAAHACGAIGCRAAIPYHWGDIVGSDADAEKFAAGASCEVTVLGPGESLAL